MTPEAAITDLTEEIKKRNNWKFELNEYKCRFIFKDIFIIIEPLKSFQSHIIILNKVTNISLNETELKQATEHTLKYNFSEEALIHNTSFFIDQQNNDVWLQCKISTESFDVEASITIFQAILETAIEWQKGIYSNTFPETTSIA